MTSVLCWSVVLLRTRYPNCVRFLCNLIFLFVTAVYENIAQIGNNFIELCIGNRQSKLDNAYYDGSFLKTLLNAHLILWRIGNSLRLHAHNVKTVNQVESISDKFSSIMEEGRATGEQEAPRLTKKLKWPGFIITLICIIVGVGLFVVFIFVVQDEQQRSPIPPMVLLVLAFLFNFLWIAAKIIRITRKNSSTHIAPEDLENPPAPSLPYNVPVNSKTAHPPSPPDNPRAFDSR